MAEIQHTVSDFVVHRLVKAADAPASVELRAGACRVDAAALRFVERLCADYAARASKGYGCFEDDDERSGLAHLLREHVVERSLDFAALAQALMRRAQACADDEAADAGGYIVIARIVEGADDCLWVFVLDETAGSAITGALDVVDCAHIDFANPRAAARIDVAGWRRGDGRYLGFVKGRSGVAPWFRRFLGCSDVVTALNETKKLVQALGDFADAEGLEPPVRDAMLERAHGYLDGLGECRAPLVLEDVAREVWPDQPERLDAKLGAADSGLSSGFVPDRRAIRPLVRFRAAGEQWKLEFDRSCLRSGAVHYDRASDTLVLSGLPEYLKRMLQDE